MGLQTVDKLLYGVERRTLILCRVHSIQIYRTTSTPLTIWPRSVSPNSAVGEGEVEGSAPSTVLTRLNSERRKPRIPCVLQQNGVKKTERGEGRVGERESRGEVGGEQKRRRKEGSEYFWLMLQMRNSSRQHYNITVFRIDPKFCDDVIGSGNQHWKTRITKQQPRKLGSCLGLFPSGVKSCGLEGFGPVSSKPFFFVDLLYMEILTLLTVNDCEKF